MNKVNVLIVDDSAVVREILTEKLNAYNMINVVGAACDPYIARNKIAKNQVDVIILDIEMPRMDGLTFLKYLMKSYPIPVIILSSLTDKINKASLQAIELGAVDIVPKPGGPYSVGNVIDELIEKIIIASNIDFNRIKDQAKSNIEKKFNNKIKLLSGIKTTNKLIAIGASTGGTIALEKLFSQFKKDYPPVVVVIHMPEKFTYTFAERLNEICEPIVKEAAHNEKALSGYIYVAPGNYHMQVKLIGRDYILKINKGPKINNQRPAVDVLFYSVAENVGQNSIGIILTGMGKDGAKGLLKIRESGGITIAQNEKSCIVFGMPKEAIDIGAAINILGLQQIPGKVNSLLLNK